MDGTLIFVHGTGVRRPAYEIGWNNFQAQAKRAGFRQDQLVSVPWGPTRREGIPDRALLKQALPPRGWFGLTTVDDASVWTYLSADPLLELRLASVGPGQGQGLSARTAQLLTGMEIDGIRGSGIHRRELRRAAKVVANSEELARASARGLFAQSGTGEAVIARAIVALLHHWHASDPPGSQPRAFRDSGAHIQFLGQIASHLGAREEVASDLGDDLKWFITAAGRFLRPWLTRLSVAFLADVFWHIRSGQIQEDLGDAVRIAVARGGQPVVVIAHSLGGIAAVDLLTNGARSRQIEVDLLVTYGSQSSILYAMDAMRYLRLPKVTKSPRQMPRWLNLYDNNDFIAFAIGPLAPIAVRRSEKRIHSNLPFPDSHGAYIDQREFWVQIKGNWPHGAP